MLGMSKESTKKVMVQTEFGDFTLIWLGMELNSNDHKILISRLPKTDRKLIKKMLMKNLAGKRI